MAGPMGPPWGPGTPCRRDVGADPAAAPGTAWRPADPPREAGPSLLPAPMQAARAGGQPARRRGRTRLTQVEPCSRGDEGPPRPLPMRGGPSPGTDADSPQTTPRPAALSDGCGWETPCRGGAAPSTHRWRQAGDGDVTRHPCMGTVLRHRWDGGVGREANPALLAPGLVPRSPRPPAPHGPSAPTASTRPSAPGGPRRCPRMEPRAADVAAPPSWEGAELSRVEPGQDSLAPACIRHIPGTQSRCPAPQTTPPHTFFSGVQLPTPSLQHWELQPPPRALSRRPRW